MEKTTKQPNFAGRNTQINVAMKKSFLLFLLCLVQICVYAQGEYYPEGTKWTEIRLDTLKYDNWYSKVNGGASVYGGYGNGGHSINASGGTGYFKAVISTASSEVIGYNVSYNNPLTIVTPGGEKQVLDGVNPDNVTSLADGVYHKFVDDEGSEFFANDIYHSVIAPSSPSLNDNSLLALVLPKEILVSVVDLSLIFLFV